MNVRTEKCTQVAISFVWLTVSLLCLPSILLHGLVPAGTSDRNQEKVIQSFIWKYLLEELKTLTSDNDDAPAIFLTHSDKQITKIILINEGRVYRNFSICMIS